MLILFSARFFFTLRRPSPTVDSSIRAVRAHCPHFVFLYLHLRYKLSGFIVLEISFAAKRHQLHVIKESWRNLRGVRVTENQRLNLDDSKKILHCGTIKMCPIQMYTIRFFRALEEKRRKVSICCLKCEY